MKPSISTGAGLALLAAAVAVHGWLSQTPAGPIAYGAAAALGGPTVVAFDVTGDGGDFYLWRLWSDGTVEYRFAGFRPSECSPLDDWGCGQWRTLPATGDGYACRPDVNGDRVVDGADLATVLGAWGPAPDCTPLPPIECTLGQVRGF